MPKDITSEQWFIIRTTQAILQPFQLQNAYVYRQYYPIPYMAIGRQPLMDILNFVLTGHNRKEH
jgi:hypothetical protein